MLAYEITDDARVRELPYTATAPLSVSSSNGLEP
jgi:hypothetical protein